jgi:hypothetical protein
MKEIIRAFLSFFFKCKDDFEKTRVQRSSFESVLAGPMSILGSESMEGIPHCAHEHCAMRKMEEVSANGDG